MEKQDFRKDLKDWLKLFFLQIFLVFVLVAVKFI